jgi:actin-like ATPase involved in cell morphogenesis
VHVAEKPLDCVVDGTGICLENAHLYPANADD